MKEYKFEEKKNDKKKINFDGNIIMIFQANNEYLNSKIKFPRLEYNASEGLVFFYCRSGKVIVELVNGSEIILTKNTVFISKPNALKNLTKIEAANMLKIYLKKEFFNLYFDCDFSIEDGKYNIFSLKNYETISFDRAINYHEYPQKLQKIFIISKTLEGLMYISNHFLNVDYTRNRMEHIRDYIVNNIEDELTIKNLADKLSISETNFKLKFKEYFGISSKEYIRNLRLEAAKDLLLNTTLNIKEIFSKVGIRNYQTFYNLFILKYGISPTKLRAEYIEERKNK